VSMSFSVKDVEEKVHPKALSQALSVLGHDRYRQYLEAIRSKRVSSFRSNNLLLKDQNLANRLRQEGIKFKPYSLITNAYQLLSTEAELKKSEAYKDGLIYLQGLSGMLPVLQMDIKKGERVLDAAASPGSKTTMISALLGEEGHIDALEPDKIRCERLLHNCQILGAKNVEVFQTTAEKFNPKENQLYDKILADVPCSGEGRFNLWDRPSYAFWKEGDPEKFARLQYKIIDHVFQFLKPGGLMVYSTCTLNKIENEGLVVEFLKSHSEAKVEPIHVLENAPREFIYGKNPFPFLRISPSENFEGFFLIKIKKKS
jgi:16S rRNA C967 or C1407 C5-methylase (RsmB/RsmF family)